VGTKLVQNYLTECVIREGWVARRSDTLIINKAHDNKIVTMDISIKENKSRNNVRADTSEVYKDISVSRAKEIYEGLTGVNIESSAEKLANRYNQRYNRNQRASNLTYPCIKVNKDLVIRAIAGVLTEMPFIREETMRSFPSGTPDYSAVRDLLLRKEVGWLDTEMVLVDVKPYHPLQELAVKESEGELEKESDEWKKLYAKSYDGYEGFLLNLLAKRYANEFNVDIEIKNGLDDYNENMLPSEERKKKREILLHDLTS
jgi:hypothetical protein